MSSSTDFEIVHVAVPPLCAAAVTLALSVVPDWPPWSARKCASTILAALTGASFLAPADVSSA